LSDVPIVPSASATTVPTSNFFMLPPEQVLKFRTRYLKNLRALMDQPRHLRLISTV
jgi:hypothetical protein